MSHIRNLYAPAFSTPNLWVSSATTRVPTCNAKSACPCPPQTAHRADEAARETIDELREGRVVARPRFGKESCSYCPLAGSCPKEEM